ncbi:MAG TPA: DNA recombination protein RmuC [Oscillospiraceae bacterium]|nr:DNA recombination protein RmuC [Oscillospiraceae bacterium]
MHPLHYLGLFLLFVLTGIALVILVKLNALSKISKGEKSGDLDTSLKVISGRLDYLSRQNADEFERGRRENALFQKDIREETSENLKTMAKGLNDMQVENANFQRQLIEKVGQSLNAISQANAEQNERQSRIISDSISRLQESNEKKLDQMRATVDEKLSETLSQRLGASFKAVSDNLESVNKSLGEMKELSSGVTDNVNSLNRVLTNVKARGSWAEVQLENILDQIIPNMFERNFLTSEKSGERVEFAVKIPTGGESKQITYLPIDSKLPMEDYIRLCAAADSADAEALKAARKALESTVLNEAKKITKYINPPLTTPFAVMYLATEGLYSEIAASRTALPEKLHSELNIMIAGPSTITALLSSLSLGFKAVAINDKANEVHRLLAAAKSQYDNFGVLLDKAKKKIDEAGDSISLAQKRSGIIRKKLGGIDEMDYLEADKVLGLRSSDENPLSFDFSVQE